MADVETAPCPRPDPTLDDNDDWLYGDESGVQATAAPDADPEHSGDDGVHKEANGGVQAGGEEAEGDAPDDSLFNDEHFAEDAGGAERRELSNGEAEDSDDSDDSDDVKVVIGEIKSGSQAYQSLNIKRGGLVAQPAADKQKAGGKFSVEDLESVGAINGVPAIEYNIDSIEDKPWNKPGADISDYFNYGLNETTWRAYCERQRRMRVQEAGMSGHGPRPPPPQHQHNHNPHSHSNTHGMMRMDEMPAQHHMNTIPVRESTIQVMTADRREYSRNKFPDMTLPPPGPDYFPLPGADPYYPAQPGLGPPPNAYHEPHWNHNEMGGGPGWTPTDIKELTPGPIAPPGMGGPIGATHGMAPHLISGPQPSHYPAPYAPPHPYHERDRERERERERERDRERDRMRERDERERRDRRDEDKDEIDRERDRDRARSHSIKPDRHRDKSHRRERSRSRSRRHKSRSRSPRPRERERARSVKPKSKDPPRKDKEEDE